MNIKGKLTIDLLKITLKLLLILPLTAFAKNTPTLANVKDAFTKKSYHNVELRLRHENAHQDNLKSSHLTSLRTRASLGTGVIYDTSAKLELTNVSTLFGTNSHNATVTGLTNSGHTVIKDLKGTGVTEMYLQNTSLSKNRLRLGRQYLLIDNQRFIGNVNFRQYPQSFSSFSILNNYLPNIELLYAYIYQVNGITSNRYDSGRQDNNSHLLNANWQGWEFGKFSIYNYRIKDKTTSTNSANTYGLRFSGKNKTDNNLVINYSAEYAKQKAKSNNPISYKAHYYLLDIGARTNSFIFNLGYEVLSGHSTDTGKSFNTPYATLHKFQGLADRFLTTPSTGLKDKYAAIGYKYKKFKFKIIHHIFNPEAGSGAKFGKEWDLIAKYKISPNYYISAAYVDFNAGSRSTQIDVRKYWLTVGANF